MAARQHLDAARPVARLLVERRPRLAESKYAMAQQKDSELLSPPQSLDIPDLNMTGSSDEDGYENDDRSEKKQHNDEDEESQVPLLLHYKSSLICVKQPHFLSHGPVHNMYLTSVRIICLSSFAR